MYIYCDAVTHRYNRAQFLQDLETKLYLISTVTINDFRA